MVQSKDVKDVRIERIVSIKVGRTALVGTKDIWISGDEIERPKKQVSVRVYAQGVSQRHVSASSNLLYQKYVDWTRLARQLDLESALSRYHALVHKHSQSYLPHRGREPQAWSHMEP